MKFIRFQQILNFFTVPRSRSIQQGLWSREVEGDISNNDTSYGTIALLDEYRWKERGGLDGAMEGCVEKRRRKAKGRLKERHGLEERQDEKWGVGKRRMKKEVKKEKGNQVIISSVQVDDQPKKARGRCGRFFTKTIGLPARHQRQRSHQRKFTDSIRY